MSLQQAISDWDGKTTQIIQRIYNEYKTAPAFDDEIIDLMHQSQPAKAASWLLKHHLESGFVPDQKQTLLIFKSLPTLHDWESRLHVLQSLVHLKIPPGQVKVLEQFLRKTLAENNKFVRAWSYSGFYELSCQYPKYQEETQQLLEMAMRDEAPSVKARIRNLSKRNH